MSTRTIAALVRETVNAADLAQVGQDVPQALVLDAGDQGDEVVAEALRQDGMRLEWVRTPCDCIRCAGKGYFPSQYHGACFRCGGSKVDPKQTDRHATITEHAPILRALHLRASWVRFAAAEAARINAELEAQAKAREDEKAAALA